MIHETAEIVFWCSIGLFAYVLFGHGLLLAFLNLFLAKPVRKAPVTPDVCFIIPAYNEGKIISEKLENTLLLDYPKERLSIVVVSDASTDSTDEIVKRFSGMDARVHLLRHPSRMGRAAAINSAAKSFRYGLYAISDANVTLDKNALKELVKSFADPEVGAVTARFIGLENGINPAEGGVARYWDYEQWMRSLESSISTLTFISGSLNAVRGDLLCEVPLDISHDNYIPAYVCGKDARAVYESRSVVYEYPAASCWKEAGIRARNFLMCANFIRELPGILKLGKHPWFFLNLLFRKILRWHLPLFLLLALISSFLILDNPFAIGFLVVSGILTLITLLTLILRNPPRLMSTIAFFTLSLAGLLWGILQFVFGKRIVTWEPPR